MSDGLYLLLCPEVLLLLVAVTLTLIQCFSDKVSECRISALALIGVALVFFSTFVVRLSEPPFPDWSHGLYIVDDTAVFFKRFFLIVLWAVLLMARNSSKEFPVGGKIFYVFPMLTGVGLLLLASAADFIMVFVALELVTISFYVLVAYQRNDARSLEAATKYLVIGGLSTAFLVYGMAFLFGTLGTTDMALVRDGLMGPVDVATYFAIALIVVGLGFKLAAVPFHVWAPDVYQGAPTPVTAFLAVGSKAAGVVVLVRIFLVDAFRVEQVEPFASQIFTVLAVLSLILGSFAAIPQRNIKRLLGYSSIGHAGFIMMGLSAISAIGYSAVITYMCVYLLAALLAFYVITLVSGKLGGDELHHYAGLYKRAPLLAFALLVSFVSMAGIPPLAGFVGKLGVFAAVLEKGNYWLAGVGLVAAVAGLYYYLGVVRYMYWTDPVRDDAPIPVDRGSTIFVSVLAALVILMGIWLPPLQMVVDSAAPSPMAVLP